MLACRVDGVTPPPAGGASHTGVDGGSGNGVCPGPVDADADGWHAASSGGHDCDDDNDRIDGCFDGEEACTEPVEEQCNGTDDDCDGAVDDPFLVHKAGGATAVAVGGLFADGEPALVVGEEGVGGADGSVALYRMNGNFVVRIAGNGQSSSFGTQLATGRDITGDGVHDLVVAAPYATTDDGPNNGVVFVFAGPIDQNVDLSDSIGWFLGGELDGQPGSQLALSPDMNGDGLGELVVGNYRHTLIFSGAPGKDARIADAAGVVEVNTGGGAWHYASGPDQDGDGRPELLFGMSTYSGGAGVVGEVRSENLSRVVTLSSSASWPGLGAGLANVGGTVWALSGSTPVRIDTMTGLDAEGSRIQNGGDVDGDGVEDLLVGGETHFSVPELGLDLLPGTLQGDRSLSGATDVDGDGRADPRVRVGDAAAIFASEELFSRCDMDGDGLGEVAGDCDDDDPERTPGKLEVCNGVDDDCDDVVDGHVQQSLALAEGLGLRSVVLLGDDSVALLDDEGQLIGGGDWAGTAVSGLSAVAYGGSLAGGDTVVLLGRHTDADTFLSPGDSGPAVSLDGVSIRDGVGLARSGEAGTIGDFDGDGLDELLVEAVDPVSHLSVVLFEGPVTESSNLDDAPWRIDVPDGWGEVAIGLLSGPGSADVTADGRGDVILGSGTAFYGQGRTIVLSALEPGVWEAEGEATLTVYGEPAEALGTSVAVGGDVDGDGVGDALLGTAYGARLLAGGECPSLAPGSDAPSGQLALVDLDEDGRFESFSVGEGQVWWGGEAWREASAIWSANAYGVVAGGDEGVWWTGATCD